MAAWPLGVRGRGAPLLVVLPAVITALTVSLPLVYIYVRAAGGGLSGWAKETLSLSALLLVGRTLLLVGGVVAVAVTIAVPLAWLVARTDLPARRIWAVIVALPLVFPSYVAAFAVVAVLGPRGYLQGWLQPFGVERLPEWAYGYCGALMALALFTYPYVYLLLVAGLSRLDPALEESARSLGSGRWETFFRVVLPALRPTLASGSLLVALYALSDFGAVSITRYTTLTVSIYNAYGSLFDRTVAASLSTVLVCLTIGFLGLEWRIGGSRRPHIRRPQTGAEIVPLGRWRWPCVAAISGVTLLSIVLPTGVIVGWGIRGLIYGNRVREAWLPAQNSLIAALLAALAATLLAQPIAVWAVRYRGRLATLVERLSYAGHALPGIVLALSMVYVSIRFLRPIYQTLPLLVAAYVIRFLPQVVAASRSALAAVSPIFEEAARSLGGRPLPVFCRMTFPMVRAGVFAGGALVFLTAMKELPATLILRPIGFETLATRIWSAAAEGFFAEASVPALTLVLISALPVYLLMIRPALTERR